MAPLALLLAQIIAVRVSAYDSLGHACPISAYEALTAWHVVVQAQPSRGVDPAPLTWESVDHQQQGTLTWRWADVRRDLVLVVSDTPFPRWVLPADRAPRVGSKVKVTGYDWESVGLPSVERLYEVSGFLPGRLLLRKAPGPGSSGSCVIDDSGRLVGIREGFFGSPSKQTMVATFPPWWPVPERWRVVPKEELLKESPGEQAYGGRRARYPRRGTPASRASLRPMVACAPGGPACW